MTFIVHADVPPVREDSAGALRVGDSRVLLELVIRAFQDGATPETIVQRHSPLTLSDVYAVIAYYLRHRREIAIPCSPGGKCEDKVAAAPGGPKLQPRHCAWFVAASKGSWHFAGPGRRTSGSRCPRHSGLGGWARPRQIVPMLNSMGTTAKRRGA